MLRNSLLLRGVMFFQLFAIILSFFVVFVNGFTDSPSSIAAAVCSGAIPIKRARAICAAFNLLGTVLASLICYSVAQFVYSLSSFGENGTKGVCAVFLTVIIFGMICLKFNLPSSESHAIIASLVGASFVSLGKATDIKRVGYVFVFMVLSCALGLIISFALGKIINLNLPYKELQHLSCSLTSFMHGWQDGQKLLSVIAILLGIGTSRVPHWLILTVALVLSVGSYMGSSGIIKSLGQDLVFLNQKSSFISDMGAYFSLLIFSLFGAPVSTGNVKSLAIMGAGLAEGEKINKKVAVRLILVSLATFPVCFILGVLIMWLLLLF